MKFKLVLLFLLFFSGLNAQLFEWAATGRNLNIEVLYSSLSSERKLVVAAETRPTEYVDGKIELLSFTKTGDTSTIRDQKRMYYTKAKTLVQFSDDGKIEWQKDLYGALYGIQHTTKNEPVLLMYFEGEYDKSELRNRDDYYDEDEESESNDKENDTTYADIRALNPTGNLPEFLASGLYGMVLNQYGHLDRIIPLLVTEDLDLDIMGFKINAQGNLYIHGTFGDDHLMKGFKLLPAKAGGEFILAYSPTGKLLWGDYLAYNRNTCCSYYSDAQSLAVAPDGTVYLAGAFNTGLRLSDGKILGVKEPKSDQVREPYESYIMAYSPAGKVLWLKQSESRAMIHKLAATNDEVFISYLWNEGLPAPFSIKADTSSKKHLVIAAFSKTGKYLWNTTHGATRVHDLVVASDQLFIAGSTYYSSNSGHVGTYKLAKLEHSYIAVYSTKGVYKKTQPLRTDFGSRPIAVNVYPVSDHEIYLAFSMFIGMKLPIRVYDKIFQDIKMSADCGVIGKITY